jgi:heat shock protein HtpX
MTRWNNHLKTVVLLGALSALLVGVGNVVAPGHLGFFAVMALGMNLGAYFWSDKLVLRMHGAKAIDPAEAPELHGMVRELAARAAIPMPRVFLIDDPQPNAFATGRNPAHGVVAVTSGILRILTPRELRGVIAHELAHIKNRDILVATIAACVTGVITYAAHAIGFLGLGGHQNDEGESASPFAGILMALTAPIAATLIQLGISRSREYLADETGAAISGDPSALASALQRLEEAAAMLPSMAAQPATASLFIVNPFSGSAGLGLARLFSTHPSTADRVARLQALAGTRLG